MTHTEIRHYQRLAQRYLDRVGIVLTEEERAGLEGTDLGLVGCEKAGLARNTCMNTDRVCAKELLLLPRQTYPQYKHLPVAFQGGLEGAVVSEFSTRSRDEADVFTDAQIRRLPKGAA